MKLNSSESTFISTTSSKLTIFSGFRKRDYLHSHLQFLKSGCCIIFDGLSIARFL